MSHQTGPPAPRPCASCPYRTDVPAGIWDSDEYERLRAYDRPTVSQPSRLFQCHQTGASDPMRRLCAGWCGVHADEANLALRLAVAQDRISPDTYHAALAYTSPAPLFASGTAAAEHGQRGITEPDQAAVAAIEKILRTRADITTDPTDTRTKPP